MEIGDKGGEIVQRYESLEIEIVQGGEIGHGHGQRGSNIEKKIGSKFLDKRSTQIGGASS